MNTNDHAAMALKYMLAKQVPALSRGGIIETDYGAIYLDPAEGEAVGRIIKKLVERKLKKLEKRK